VLERPPPGAELETCIVWTPALRREPPRVIARRTELTKFVFMFIPSKITSEPRVKPVPEIRTFSDLRLSMRADCGVIDVIAGTGLIVDAAAVYTSGDMPG